MTARLGHCAPLPECSARRRARPEFPRLGQGRKMRRALAANELALFRLGEDARRIPCLHAAARVPTKQLAGKSSPRRTSVAVQIEEERAFQLRGCRRASACETSPGKARRTTPVLRGRARRSSGRRPDSRRSRGRRVPRSPRLRRRAIPSRHTTPGRETPRHTSPSPCRRRCRRGSSRRSPTLFVRTVEAARQFADAPALLVGDAARGEADDIRQCPDAVRAAEIVSAAAALLAHAAAGKGEVNFHKPCRTYSGRPRALPACTPPATLMTTGAPLVKRGWRGINTLAATPASPAALLGMGTKTPVGGPFSGVPAAGPSWLCRNHSGALPGPARLEAWHHWDCPKFHQAH